MDAEPDDEAIQPPPAPKLPPESSTTVWTRRLILIAFWTVVIALGLPHWYWTTSIHRSSLPLDDMHAWADGQQCQLHYPLDIGLQASTLTNEQASYLSDKVESLLKAERRLPLHTFLVTPNSTSTHRVLTVGLEDSSHPNEFRAALLSSHALLQIFQNPQNAQLDQLAAFIATEVHKVFEDESASLQYLLSGTPFAPDDESSPLTTVQQAVLERRNTKAFKYAPTYHLTFSLFTPLATPSAWEIDQALKEYIRPLLASLSSINDFTLDTQVQLYATFSPSISGPVYDNSTNSWRLAHTDLPGFINAAEWPLSPSIGAGPTINFVLYVPSEKQSPLLIGDGDDTSWIVPQWGGVQIHNPSKDQASALTVDDLRPDMLVFTEQLAALIGMPQSPQSLALRTSSLARERATSLVVSASSTLGALARLTLKLTSIAIPDNVARSVDEAIHRLEQACLDIRGGDFKQALDNARVAEAEAEKAFFEPSMVGQVYFPDEHKVAVYVPLLGPMAVPLLMAAVKELRSLRNRNKNKTA